MKSVAVFLLVALFGIANAQPLILNDLLELIGNPNYKPKTIIGEVIQGVRNGIEDIIDTGRLQEVEEEQEEQEYQDHIEIENTESSIKEAEQKLEEMRSALGEKKQAVESKLAEAKKLGSGWIESDKEDRF